MEKEKPKKNLLRIIAVDFLMIIILLINLLWIIFDWIFGIPFINNLFAAHNPNFHQTYSHIHQNFFYYDLIFVGIFVIEIIIRWIIAIVKRTYFKWFFYPAIHFYDVLGCIPAGGWVIFRFLRIFSIIYRLNKLEIIDLTKSYIFVKLNKYYRIFVEEISDRVVLNVLDGIQLEAQGGTPMVQKIMDNVILPNKEQIISIALDKIQNIAKTTHQNHKTDLDNYIKTKVENAFEQNQEVKIIAKVPILGQSINSTLKNAIYDIVLNVFESVLNDLHSNENSEKINQITENIFNNIVSTSENKMNSVIEKMIVESVNIIKERVKVQQWKIQEIEEQEEKLKNDNSPRKEKILKILQKQRLEAIIKDPFFRIKRKKQ